MTRTNTNQRTELTRTEAPLKPLSLQQISEMYGISARTFKKWLLPHLSKVGDKQGRFYTAAQVRIIFALFGTPVPQPQQVKKEVRNETPGKVVIHPDSVELLTDSTWSFSRCILWNDLHLSETEREIARDLIREHYSEIPAEEFSEKSKELFIRFLERVLLARLYRDKSEYRYVPHPCIWLEKSFLKGFAGTLYWYERVQQEREKNPEYFSDVRFVCELYADYCLSSSTEVFKKASEAFATRGAKMLSLFDLAIRTKSADKSHSLTA